MGTTCSCRKQYFTFIRDEILDHFNLLSTIDELMQINNRTTNNEQTTKETPKEARFREATQLLRVRAKIGGNVKEIVVCRKAFISIHGITKSNVEHLVSDLKPAGYAPKDKRGKHTVWPHKLTTEILSSIHHHIKSFKGRRSLYGLKNPEKNICQKSLTLEKCTCSENFTNALWCPTKLIVE